ncbi:unnamed protein product [Menidia menidia]|uniref:(Atlantic silverside) hypothetical protein n=1 Tax=Menidia menidia TaxID=238744 RepID=A0A8S4BFL4_9TELE|nr:unnamed protein product [Menidia menidia]
MEYGRNDWPQVIMEAGEENCSTNLKRQREPLSDSEDNVHSAPVNDGLKRRRLEAAGQENRSPKQTSSGRLAELETKPDTPIVPSVRSRVQLLTQRDGAPLAQRCLSDPGAHCSSVSVHDKEHLLGEGEFNQRKERFKSPLSQASPAFMQSPSSSCPRSRSHLVTGIQQMLQCSTTPSSKQASRIRQERDEELNQLRFQPISENAWLKRSSSDSSLTQPVSSREEQDRDGHHSEDFREEKEHKVSVMNEDQQACSEQPESQTVLMLSFSEGQQSFLESTFQDESKGKERMEVSEISERDTSEVLTLDEDETVDNSSCAEEQVELSTEEDLKMWRYPQRSAYQDEESVGGKEQEACSQKAFESSKLDKEKAASESCLDDSVIEESGFEGDQEKVEVCAEGVAKAPQKGVACADESEAMKGGSEAWEESQMEKGELDRNIAHVELSAARQGVLDGQRDETQEKRGKESSKKVTFILKPELINSSALSASDTSMESRAETSLSGEISLGVGVQHRGCVKERWSTWVKWPETGLSSHDETNTAELIEQMFDEVLEYAERAEEDRNPDEDIEDRDSGIGVCSGGKDKMDTDGEKREETEAKEEEDDPNRKLDSIGDELLTFPPSGILSPLSKSVEAVVTPLRLAAAQESNPPSLLLTPEETSTPPAESAPLYRLSKLPTIQSVTPAVQRRAPDTSKPQPSINAKEKITALNEEAGKLQNVINQTLQALSCCIDEEHGRGSLEEAEAEKLLLVSCEKRSALLAEVARLREERSSESEEAAKEDTEYVSLQPCRGTVSITSIQLPLKVEFVCSSHNRTGRASHYFFVLIRYGPCNIVATPLATAADARNGDTISFPTSVTLKDIRSSFEIDVEVYSLSHTSGTSCSMDRTATTTKSRASHTEKASEHHESEYSGFVSHSGRLQCCFDLNLSFVCFLQRSSNTVTSTTPTTLSARRSSNFSLVGSHKISLASLGHTKFPLDKMKFEGKIKRLLGDEFLEKVPFLSPLEGNIYLHLDSKSHSNVQHQGFLTMFELISGFGVWHRRFFILEGCNMCYWNHPNDRETKEAEGSVSLSRFPSQCVRPVKRDSCARPFTFELVSSIAQQQDQNQEALAKCWFSADTKQERLDWMEKLNQALLDFHTWNRTESESQQANTSIGGSLRESIL